MLTSWKYVWASVSHAPLGKVGELQKGGRVLRDQQSLSGSKARLGELLKKTGRPPEVQPGVGTSPLAAEGMAREQHAGLHPSLALMYTGHFQELLQPQGLLWSKALLQRTLGRCKPYHLRTVGAGISPCSAQP